MGIGELAMKMNRMDGPRTWATGLCAVLALGSAHAAETYKADALLSVDMNRAAVAEKVSAAWAKEIPAAQNAAFKAKLLGLRADQLLAASLSGTFDGVLEIMAPSPSGNSLPAIGSAQTYYASRADLTVMESNDTATRNTKDQAKATGETARDLVYTPLAPCRLFDTRAGQGSALGVVGGTFSNQQTRTILPAGACGIPTTGVASLFISFHSYNNIPSTLGVIGFMKPGAPFSALAATWTGAPWATGTYITQTNPNGSFDAFIGNGQTMTADLIVDVMGYFQAPDRNGDGLRVSAPVSFGTLTSVNVVNGSSANSLVAGITGATISGGGSLSGFNNSVSGNFGTVSGGYSNSARFGASVGGGAGNNASGNYAVIGGGNSNGSDGASSTVAGGASNRATGSESFVGGGSSNTVSGSNSSIVGGKGGKVTGNNSILGNGGFNIGSTCFNFISTVTPNPSDGQCFNEINANASFLGSGIANVIAATAIESGIVGGSANRIAGAKGFIGGGVLNSIEELNGATPPTAITSSVIVGGRTNIVRNSSAAIVAGTNNVASGNRSFIGGGDGNLASGDRAVIVGGGTNYIPVAGATDGCFNFVNPNPVLDGTCVNRAQGRRNFIGAGTGNETNNNESVAVGGLSNRATGLGSIVVGGIANTASGDRAIVVGGGSTSVNTCYNRATGLSDGPCQNVASGQRSTIVGGAGNVVSGADAFVGAGVTNTVSGLRAVVAGGLNNLASGLESSVIGGRTNVASGAFSFAGGRNAKTETIDATPVVHHGAFVWADSQDDGAVAGSTGQPFRSSAGAQFAVRARGGVVFKTDNTTIAANAGDATAGCALLPGGSASWSCSSDRNLKDGIKAISPKDVLSKVVNLPLSTWQFKGTSRRHLSPMAQDFWAAFGFGEDDRHITASDVSGVALAAVQGVNQKMNDELASLKAKNVQLQRSNEAMMRELAAIKKKLGF
jgi:hypothetical protein